MPLTVKTSKEACGWCTAPAKLGYADWETTSNYESSTPLHAQFALVLVTAACCLPIVAWEALSPALPAAPRKYSAGSDEYCCEGNCDGC